MVSCGRDIHVKVPGSAQAALTNAGARSPLSPT